MTAINTAINQTEYNRPTDSRDVDTVLGLLPFLKAAWSFFPIKYVNRTYFDQPETFWTPLIDAVNKTSLRRGLLHGYEVGGPRENKYLFINFIDYILSLAKRLKVTDPLTLANFINTGETSLFTDGILPTYFKIIEVEDRGEKKNEYEALPPDNIDLLRGRLFARMYTKFLTDEAGGLKPGFDHYFHLKAKNIKTALGELIWQLKLPLIGAGELYQLSVQAQSGETITLQQAVLAKMMDSLRGQYNGQQMAQLVTRSKEILKKEIAANRSNPYLCQALAGCLKTVIEGAETAEDPKYSKYTAQKLALTKAGSGEETIANAAKIQESQLVATEPGQVEKTILVGEGAKKYSPPVDAIKVFWDELGSDLIDESYGYGGVADITPVFINKLNSVMANLKEAPREVQAVFIEIGREVLKKAVKNSKKLQLVSVFELLVNEKTLSAGQQYLAEVRATDPAAFVQSMIKEIRDKKIGAGAEFSVIEHLRSEWKRMIEAIAAYPEELQQELLTASSEILNAITDEPNPVIQNELALLYTKVYADVSSVEQIAAGRETVALRDWIKKAAKKAVQEFSQAGNEKMKDYFNTLLDGLFGPCGFRDRVNLAPIMLAYHNMIEKEMGEGRPATIGQFVLAFMTVLKERMKGTQDEGLLIIYEGLTYAFEASISRESIYNLLARLTEQKGVQETEVQKN